VLDLVVRNSYQLALPQLEQRLPFAGSNVVELLSGEHLRQEESFLVAAQEEPRHSAPPRLSKAEELHTYTEAT
jgi:hypothetical protein